MSLSKRVFKPEKPRILLIAAGILMLLAFAVVAAIFAFQKSSHDVEKNSASKSVLTSADFMLSEGEAEYTTSQYYLYREKRQKWDEKMISSYWYPISDILTDIISKRNDQKVEAILKP